MKKLILPLMLFNIFLVMSSVTYAKSIPRMVHDGAITAKIVAAYNKDSLLNPFVISVNTQKGVVYLSGTVDTDMQYERAVSLAESTHGVEDVIADNLQVKSSESPIKDTYITAKIKGKLLGEAVFGKRDISSTDVHVETKDGVVYLSGQVDNAKQKEKILQIVKSVKGVKDIKEDLTV